MEHLQHHDGKHTDIFVVEAGSDEDKLSKNCTWHANTPEIQRDGLRYPRGMNYGLLKLWQAGEWNSYKAFFLLTNDTELSPQPTVQVLLPLLEEHPSVGIFSPCSRRWGERLLLKDEPTKYFWYIHNKAYFMRREFMENIMETEEPSHMNFVFDGSNFRGYMTESELIAKAYANDWAAAITSKVFVEENESYLLTQADLIKTEPFEQIENTWIEEGIRWLRRKYGFNSRWSMQQYVKLFYDQFF